VNIAQLTSPKKSIKYSEYPVKFIFQLFVNGTHVETIVTKDQFFEKMNKKQWIWSGLENRSNRLVLTTKELYFDGTRVI